MRKFLLTFAIVALLLTFRLSPNAQEIAAGVAIFLFGVLMLEDGFRLFGASQLQQILERATRSTSRALVFGIASTSLLQSSSLVSVITISFLSAGLISLIGGVGIIFGANIGTTTGAWLVAGFGLKVNIGAFAMPMLALAIVLVFQKPKGLKGLGYALGGLGFLFLGIHYMKEGFEAFRDQIDLARFALPGLLGLVVFTLTGMVATVVMQSSHATMVLVITALAAGQVTYDNALALAIGANIGTTVTAILGSVGANIQGKRLALAHLIFNLSTAGVALIALAPLRSAVDWISGTVGIASGDFALKLAVFHTVFNVLGVALMLPLLHRLVAFLERTLPAPEPDVSQPRFLNEAVDDFPATLESALRKEVLHLYENATEVIFHGLNVHRADIYESRNIAETVRRSRRLIDLDIDDLYERRIKTLYSAIVDFTTRAGERRLASDVSTRIYALRDVASGIVKAVKSVKHLRKNVVRFTTRPQGTITELYDGLRTEISQIVFEIRKLGLAEPDQRSVVSLDQERAEIDEAARSTTRRVDELIRSRKITADEATSFLNDSGYAYGAMRDLLEAARAYYGERDSAMAEVERLLALDEDELEESVAGSSPPATTERNTNVTQQEHDAPGWHEESPKWD